MSPRCPPGCACEASTPRPPGAGAAPWGSPRRSNPPSRINKCHFLSPKRLRAVSLGVGDTGGAQAPPICGHGCASTARLPLTNRAAPASLWVALNQYGRGGFALPCPQPTWPRPLGSAALKQHGGGSPPLRLARPLQTWRRRLHPAPRLGLRLAARRGSPPPDWPRRGSPPSDWLSARGAGRAGPRHTRLGWWRRPAGGTGPGGLGPGGGRPGGGPPGSGTRSRGGRPCPGRG